MESQVLFHAGRRVRSLSLSFAEVAVVFGFRARHFAAVGDVELSRLAASEAAHFARLALGVD